MGTPAFFILVAGAIAVGAAGASVSAAEVGMGDRAAAAPRAADVRIEGGPGRVSLVELYTSEGCSSCPSADKWLAALRAKPGLWKDFVPLSFHVNYWDRLGWPDRFATRGYTERQYAFASAWGSNSVYTPCFVLDGGEWHPSGGSPATGSGRPGVLSVVVGAGGLCAVEFVPDPGAGAVRGGLRAHVALLGGGFVSKVTAGENRGETLTHEFVTLGVTEGDLVPGSGRAAGAAARMGGTGNGGLYRGTFSLPKAIVDGSARTALAAWVTRPGDLSPIQAAGGWLQR